MTRLQYFLANSEAKKTIWNVITQLDSPLDPRMSDLLWRNVICNQDLTEVADDLIFIVDDFRHTFAFMLVSSRGVSRQSSSLADMFFNVNSWRCWDGVGE